MLATQARTTSMGPKAAGQPGLHCATAFAAWWVAAGGHPAACAHLAAEVARGKGARAAAAAAGTAAGERVAKVGGTAECLGSRGVQKRHSRCHFSARSLLWCPARHHSRHREAAVAGAAEEAVKGAWAVAVAVARVTLLQRPVRSRQCHQADSQGCTVGPGLPPAAAAEAVQGKEAGGRVGAARAVGLGARAAGRARG